MGEVRRDQHSKASYRTAAKPDAEQAYVGLRHVATTTTRRGDWDDAEYGDSGLRRCAGPHGQRKPLVLDAPRNTGLQALTLPSLARRRPPDTRVSWRIAGYTAINSNDARAIRQRIAHDAG